MAPRQDKALDPRVRAGMDSKRWLERSIFLKPMFLRSSTGHFFPSRPDLSEFEIIGTRNTSHRLNGIGLRGITNPKGRPNDFFLRE